ncbi:neuraminidase-like domain-containing protein [Microbulbifer sp. ZKSA006]|uniref:Tc toxin subunit A-related protein n=1 Tax=Microbulbifer sp. ZKSA006 TaxID=3243390 RepID=UPI004039EC3B
MAQNNIIMGAVTSNYGDSTEGLLVRAYDMGLRSLRPLGETSVGADGKYLLQWVSKSDVAGEESIALGLEILVPISETLLFRTAPDSTLFPAGSREVINVTLKQRITRESIEYDVLKQDIQPLMGNLRAAELEETSENGDVSLLAKRTGQSPSSITYLALAERLEEASGIEAPFFYALLQQGTLLRNDFRQPLQLRLSVDIDSDTTALLYEAALTDSAAIEQGIQQAVAEKVITSETANNVAKHLDTLSTYKDEAQKFADTERQERILGVISQFVTKDKLNEATTLLNENPGNLDSALEKIANKAFLVDASSAPKLKTELALGEILGFDKVFIDQVAKRENISSTDEIGRLAKLSKEDWSKLLKQADSEIRPSSKPLASGAIETYAKSLTLRLESAYPSEAFLAQLERDKQPRIKNRAEITALINEAAKFDLKSTNIDQLFEEKQLTGEEHQASREELKKVQRVYRLAPQYDKVTGLLDRGITSSRDIVAKGKSLFLKEIAPAAGIKSEEAGLIYAKAESLSSAAMMVAGDLQDLAAANVIPSINTKKLAVKAQQVAEDYPNLKSLFKGTDTCACEHCRSVYGPAAYLVELLEFVDSRNVTDLTVAPPVTTNHARDLLFERRPDLGEIDLNCANAVTPVPYIDLVCEQLETLIAPDTGIPYSGDLASGSDPLVGSISPNLHTALLNNGIPISENAQVFPSETLGVSTTLPHYIRDTKAVVKAVNQGGNNYTLFRLRQTLSPAEELAAAPEYVNQAAYSELASSNFAFTLPFDLHHTEAIAYFDRFDVDRAELMRRFQVGSNPQEYVIAAERLGLNDSERQLITQTDIAGQNDYWNTPLPDLAVVSTFLDKTALTYLELNRLLALNYIDPDSNLFIRHLDLTCNLDQKEIANLDNSALDRIHRFLRLQKVTGWKLETLDAIISQPALGGGQLDNDTISLLGDLSELSRLSEIDIDDLIACYGEIPLQNYPLVFQNKAKNGVIDEALARENIDGTGFLADVAGSLATCLQIDSESFNRLLTLLADNILNIENLSSLLLLTHLMHRQKLSAEDIDILIDLCAVDPLLSPLDTLEFVHYAQVTRSLPIGLSTLRFWLYHQAEDLEVLELKTASIEEILGQLQGAYQQAWIDNASPFDANLESAEQQEALLKLLGQFTQVSEDDGKAILGFLERDWDSAAAAKGLIDNLFAATFDTLSINAAIDTLDLLAPDADISQASKDLLQVLMSALSSHQFFIAKQQILTTSIASAFKADSDIIDTILKAAELKQPLPGHGVLAELLLADDLIDTLNQPPVPPVISAGNFPLHFAALRLLHKLVPLALSLQVDAALLNWLLQHSEALDWLEIDKIPNESGQQEQRLDDYLNIILALQLAEELPAVADPADAGNAISFWSVLAMTLPGSAASREDFLDRLALLSAHDLALLDALDTHFFPAFDLSEYRKPATWSRILESAELARQLSSSVEQIQQFIKPALNSDDTQQLRQALKSRYDESTWLGTLKEVMDAIRPQKRDALIAYLLATRPEFNHTNDLYDHLLIDVEMEACMPSSRIVQAHNAIQLFVQRCLLGLEPRAAADKDNDSGWEHWKWLKLYRLREVNYKIFLYPENWIEAELRDDKSSLFVELEDELQQNELTEFTAEQAFIGYMQRLDDLAFLEVVATWYQTSTRIMHVFARTKSGDPATYYYRRFEQERYWTPWELVDLDITSDQLLALERNNRLTLAWPIFSEEPDPNPESTVPDSTPGTVAATDKPKRKLKIQLAVSEFADGRWQPKRVSKDAVLTPSSYTTANLQQELYNLIYLQAVDQVLLLKALGQDATELRGSFLLTGCKGYPELATQGNAPFPDFFPDFKDTLLTVQRYKEWNWDPADQMAARTALTPFGFYDILNRTPGNFRITYPHQMTIIDWAMILIQYLFILAYSNSNSTAAKYDKVLKFPLGTLLPYFMEDSEQGYVIIPGFYARASGDPSGELTSASSSTTEVRRTASDVIQFIEDALNLYLKVVARVQAGESFADVVQDLPNDDDYQKLLSEFQTYTELQYGERFANMYHPLMCAFRKILYQEGIPALMRRSTQMQQTAFSFANYYDPAPVVPEEYPIEDVDFASDGSYSGYNWEIFFHLPMLIATQLTRNQRFEEAMEWLHFIFNPTGALPGEAPNKYWVTKPFFLRSEDEYIEQRIDQLLYRIADPNTPEIKELEFAIRQWRDKPFSPHVVARFRSVAYQKAILMKYIDNLVEWGDYLFRQDTMESIAQATQMYILADKLLGPKPRVVPPVVEPPPQTYNQLQGKLGALGNALVELENILPDLAALPEGGAELPPAPITLSMLYFCIPQNEQMVAYWDRIADRLFKIRHCQNIDGVERSLALFAPPIDPAMLVKAAASGLDISSVIAGLNAPLPYYRFSSLSQKASEFAGEVRSLGSSLLQALEKRDAEELALLRSELEIKLLEASTQQKELAIEETTEQIEVLRRTRKVTEERHQFYANIEKISAKEQLNLDKLAKSQDMQLGSQISRTLAGVMAMAPSLLGGASGFGGSPHITLEWGGKNLAAAANSAADVLDILAGIAAYEANRASITGGYNRRFEDWKHQESQALLELDSIDQQITAAEIRKAMAEEDLKNHQRQIDNAHQTEEYMHSKFTNQELYQWMLGKISSVYFSAYKLAHDLAKKAERNYQFELGRQDSFIAYGYWDSLKKGLQCADKLIYDINRMSAAYLDNNKREYEVTKHISLAQLDPLALARLRATGSCDFEIAEAILDLDHPGHYFRRIRAVSLSMPCVAGPQTSVGAKLSLVANKYRRDLHPDNLAGTGYAEDPGNDERFAYNIGAIQSIATSAAQQDSGMFELNFRDDRYLPFEGTGAISSWRLELPSKTLAQFNYDTIADVVLHLSYTARDGGSGLRALAETSMTERLQLINQELGRTGLHSAIDLKHELPNEWHLLKGQGSTQITLERTQLPYLAQSLEASISHIVLLAQVADNPATFALDIDDAPVNLARIDEWGLCQGEVNTIALDTPFELSVAEVDQDKLEKLLLIVKYTFNG